MDERLKRQLDFILEIDKEKNIFRQTHLSGHGRAENDAEHAWHMAVMAWLLREYANEELDPRHRGDRRRRHLRLGSERLFEVVDGIIREQIGKGNLPEGEE